MKFEIRQRITSDLIFSIETDSWKLAIEAAIKANASLSRADLSEADLSESDLSNANLSEVDLSWANLSEANLTGTDLSEAILSRADLSKTDFSKANLCWADLSNATLREANLTEANLSWANLSNANLCDANLSKANLCEANLSETNLSWVDLSEVDLGEADPRSLRHIKHDIWGVLLHARSEVAYLRAAIAEGRVDGSVYQGECACLCGTIANACNCSFNEIPGVQPDTTSLAERFFTAIKKGDTPKTNSACKLVLEWIDEFVALSK